MAKKITGKKSRPVALLLKVGDKRFLVNELMWELPLDQFFELIDHQKIIEFELKPAKEGNAIIEGH